MGQVLNRRRYMVSRKKGETLVWVNFSLLKGNSVYKGNSHVPQWNNIPIYAVAATPITVAPYNCRLGLSSNSKQDFDPSYSDKPARIWLAGNNTNQLCYKYNNNEYSTAWLTYSQAGWELSKTITLYNGTSLSCSLYNNSEPSKVSSLDRAGAGVVYFYICQANSPIESYYALIKESDLDRILNK